MVFASRASSTAPLASSTPTLSPVLRSFAVFSPSLSKDREDRAEDNILFYHPPRDTMNRRLNQVGFCIAVASLCDRFAGSPPANQARRRRGGEHSACTREHDIQCGDRVISLTNPVEDLWFAAEISTHARVDRNIAQLTLNRCFDLFAILYGTSVIRGLLIPPAEESPVSARSRAALHAHCACFVSYLEARLAANGSDTLPYLTLTTPVLDIVSGTTVNTVGSRRATAATCPPLLAVSEAAKERLHLLVKSELRQLRGVLAPQTLDFDVSRASRHVQTGWETLAERPRGAPAHATATPLSRRESRRQQATSRVLWVVLSETTTRSRAPLDRTYTMAVAGETFPRRLLTLLTLYLDAYGVPAPGDHVPWHLFSNSHHSPGQPGAGAQADAPSARDGPSHWLLVARTDGVVVACVVPAGAMRESPTRPADAVSQLWAAWLARLAGRVAQCVREDVTAAGGTLADDVRLVSHGTDASQFELRRYARHSLATQNQPPLSPQRTTALLGAWLMHGQSIIRGPAPRVAPPLVWRAITRLMGYVRSKRAAPGVASALPECLWLPCGPYWLSLAVATTDPDGTNGDILVSVFHASHPLEQCFRCARELSASLLF